MVLSCYGCINRNTSECHRCIGWNNYESNTLVNPLLAINIGKAENDIEQGKDKYRAYFIKTKLYEKWRDDVDTILVTEGYEECIVTE